MRCHPGVLLLTGSILYWCNIDIMTSTHLNHHPRNTSQPTLRHRSVAVDITVTIRTGQTLHLQYDMNLKL